MRKILSLLIVAVFLVSPCFGAENSTKEAGGSALDKIPLMCPDCGFEFYMSRWLYNNEDNRQFACENCGKIYLPSRFAEAYQEKKSKDAKDKVPQFAK